MPVQTDSTANSGNDVKMSYNMNFDIYSGSGFALSQFNAPASTVLLNEDKKGFTTDPTNLQEVSGCQPDAWG